jgi:hypothetical protein
MTPDDDEPPELEAARREALKMAMIAMLMVVAGAAGVVGLSCLVP